MKLESTLYRNDERPGYVEVKATNIGRRPIFLRMLWGHDRQGHGSGKALSSVDGGIKLGENEFKVIRITHLPRGSDEFDATGIMGDEDDICDFRRMWIEDSTGKRHEIPQLRRLLPQLQINYREWCRRTGYWERPMPALSPSQPAKNQFTAE